MVAEITVVTTSWRLPDTYIFGVQAGARCPFAYPEAPLLWRSKDHHWTAVECCSGWLTSLLCHLSLLGSPVQSCRTAHCKSRSHELMFILPCWLVCELGVWDILPWFEIIFMIRRTLTKVPSSHNIQSHPVWPFSQHANVLWRKILNHQLPKLKFWCMNAHNWISLCMRSWKPVGSSPPPMQVYVQKLNGQRRQQRHIINTIHLPSLVLRLPRNDSQNLFSTAAAAPNSELYRKSLLGMFRWVTVFYLFMLLYF